MLDIKWILVTDILYIYDLWNLIIDDKSTSGQVREHIFEHAKCSTQWFSDSQVEVVGRKMSLAISLRPEWDSSEPLGDSNGILSLGLSQ